MCESGKPYLLPHLLKMNKAYIRETGRKLFFLLKVILLRKLLVNKLIKKLFMITFLQILNYKTAQKKTIKIKLPKTTYGNFFSNTKLRVSIKQGSNWLMKALCEILNHKNSLKKKYVFICHRIHKMYFPALWNNYIELTLIMFFHKEQLRILQLLGPSKYYLNCAIRNTVNSNGKVHNHKQEHVNSSYWWYKGSNSALS